MPTGCSTSRKSDHTLWFSLVIVTFVGCGMLLYLSYHYRGKYTSSCENCENNKNIRSEKLTQSACPNICSSKECVFAANVLLENIDYSVDPCEDFYSFSCGNWEKRFDKHDNNSVIDEMEMTIKIMLKDLLDNLNGTEEGQSEKLKTVYDSCMNEDTSEFNTAHSIREFLKVLGIEGWPDLAPNFQFAESSIERTIGKFAAYDEFAFVRFIITDHVEEKESPLHLFNLTVIQDYFLMLDEAEWEFYEAIFLKTMKYIGISPEKANSTWEDFKKIDTALYKLYLDSNAAEREIPGFEESTNHVDCSSETSDYLVQMCEALKHFVNSSKIGHRFYEDRTYYSTSKYLENLLPFLKNNTQREVANYLSLRFILKNLDVMDIRFRSILLTHTNSRENIEVRSFFKMSIIQWEQCVTWVTHNMPYAVGQAFVSKLSAGQLEEMDSIVRIYIQEAAIYISKQMWIEEYTRNRLKDSIGNMTNRIEYLVNVLLNGSTFTTLLEDYNPTNQSFLLNVLKYRKNILRFYLFQTTDIHTDTYLENIFVVNAYHIPGTVDVRMGMFLKPVYQYGLPKFLNLVSMGSVVAHEIGHEIVVFFEDSENLKIDTQMKYQEKKRCVEEQYFEYEVKKIGVKVKGNETIVENLADLIAIEITQQVMDKYSRKSNEYYDDFGLPAMNVSNRQLLYISNAQLWCSVRSLEMEQKHYKEDKHSPKDIRLNGILRNLPEFSKEFSCSPNSNMNPDNRCSIRDSI